MVNSSTDRTDNNGSASLLSRLRDESRQQIPASASSFENYRQQEEESAREKRLRSLWKALPSARDEIIVWKGKGNNKDASDEGNAMERERREQLRRMYNHELMTRVGGGEARGVDYRTFVKVCTLLRCLSMEAYC